jgi:cytochrome c oxidase subunit I
LPFGLSGWQLSQELVFDEDVLIYGEMLFWGGGHILQYAWVQLMLIAWVLMLQHLLPDFSAGRGVRIIFYSNVIAVLTSPIPYALHPVTSGDFRELFTWLMAWTSGIAPVLFVLYYSVVRLQAGRRVLPAYSCMISASLYWSVLLFALGGAFAMMINGINVKIPAHYHGSLLGITVALMGLTYLLLQTHFGNETAKRLGFWQPALLGVGQVMHIGGLFASGGYGVQRKSPSQGGEAMELADFALRIQSSGGGLAIIGGLLFLIVCYKIWRNRQSI